MSGPIPTSLSLAEEMIGLSFTSLSPTDVEKLKDLVLDNLAVTLCGSVQTWGHMLTAWAGAHGGEGPANLVGTGRKAPVATAAMVNGTAAHGYELDDTHEPAHSHPGAVVIPAALAVAQEQGSSGRDLLAAIAAGYEAMVRIGMANDPSGIGGRGFHKTSLSGPFGAATAAAKLMGMDAEGLARAWGLALSMTGGATQFAYEPAGTMVKRMHAGIPAQNGVIAAQIAAQGVTAPVRALEGEAGMFKLFGANPDPRLLGKSHNEPLEIHQISYKPYSCCRKFHAVIDALEQATDGFSLPVERITAIEVHTPESAIEKHQMRRPESIMAAQYSMPYIVGATLAYGPRRYDAFGEAFHRDPAILSVIDKTTAHEDARLERDAPGRMPGRVVVRLIGGASREARVLEALGSPENPLDRRGIVAKAAALLNVAGHTGGINPLTEAVAALGDATNVTKLIASVSPP
jgi:2-methylcitrate dehydratase PrpD